MTRVALTVGLVVMLAAPARAQDAAPATDAYSPESMLVALRERDHVVDNYRIRFTRRETKRIDEAKEFAKDQFTAFKFGQPAGKPPATFPKPYDAVLVANMDMSARGDNLATRNVWLTDFHGHPQIPRNSMVVEDGASIRELDDSTGEWILTVHSRNPALGSLNQEYRMFYELALGVGFGRRIKIIDSIEKIDAGWKLTGTFQLWTEDQTTFEIETDADLFVRKAHLHANVHGNETTFVFTNEGPIEMEGHRAFAKDGTAKRVHLAFTPPNGTRHADGTVQFDYALEVGRLDFDLTAEQYAELSAIDAAQADFVIDERPQN